MKIINPITKKPAPKGVIIVKKSAKAPLLPVAASQTAIKSSYSDAISKSANILRDHAPKRFIAVTCGVMIFIVGVLFALTDISNSFKEMVAKRKIHFSWSYGADKDLVNDKVALEGKISLLPMRNRAARVTQTSYSAAPNSQPSGPRGRSSQALVTQVLRIIGDSNKRQTQARRLAMSIVSESMRQQYDPLFVAAVIKSESAFNEMAVSNKGAQGLMQIMPQTGRYLAQSQNVNWPVPAKLTDAGYNLHLGVTYLKQLEQMYQGNRLLTLVAYNWGPGNLDKAIRTGHGVPAECYRYALKILRDHHLWGDDTVITS